MQFRDLKRQYQVLKEDIDKAILEVVSDCNFISGRQVKELEEELTLLKIGADAVGMLAHQPAKHKHLERTEDRQGQQHVHVVRHDDGDARPSVIRTKDGDVVLNRMPPLTPDEHIHKLSDILDANDTVPDKYTLSDATFSYLRQHKAKHQARGNGFGYTVADVDGISRTLSARYGKDGSEILIPQSGKNPRKLAPRECARLQGFPDTFDIPVSDTQAYHQFGNSVVVPLVTDIAKSMVSELKQLDIEWSKQMMTNVLLQP